MTDIYRIDSDEDMLLELQGFLNSLANMRILPDAIQADLNEFVELLADRGHCPLTLQKYAIDAIGCNVDAEDIPLDGETEIIAILDAGNLLLTTEQQGVQGECLRAIKERLNNA